VKIKVVGFLLSNQEDKEFLNKLIQEMTIKHKENNLLLMLKNKNEISRSFARSQDEEEKYEDGFEIV
jgi:hypothetical protein